MQQPPDNLGGDDVMAGITWAKLAANGIIAIAGGIVHELAHGKGYSFVRFAAGSFIGCFTGALAYAICSHIGVGEWLKVCVTGMAGYSGAPLLDTGSRVLRYFVERNIPK